MTFNHITSKQFWLAEHVNKNKVFFWDVFSPPVFFISFYSIFNWLMSMKYQMEECKNRHRPLTPTSHFLVSIEYQYCSNPKEDASQTRPIKSL